MQIFLSRGDSGHRNRLIYSRVLLEALKKSNPKRPTTKLRKKQKLSSHAKPERTQIDLAFETAMLEMSFDNLAGLMKTLGIPSPQETKIKQQAKLIAMFNQKMIESGHPDQVINMGEKLMPWILKISTAGMFIEPLGKLLLKMGDKKKKDDDGIKEEKESTRG